MLVPGVIPPSSRAPGGVFDTPDSGQLRWQGGDRVAAGQRVPGDHRGLVAQLSEHAGPRAQQPFVLVELALDPTTAGLHQADRLAQEALLGRSPVLRREDRPGCRQELVAPGDHAVELVGQRSQLLVRGTGRPGQPVPDQQQDPSHLLHRVATAGQQSAGPPAGRLHVPHPDPVGEVGRRGGPVGHSAQPGDLDGLLPRPPERQPGVDHVVRAAVGHLAGQRPRIRSGGPGQRGR